MRRLGEAAAWFLMLPLYHNSVVMDINSSPVTRHSLKNSGKNSFARVGKTAIFVLLLETSVAVVDYKGFRKISVFIWEYIDKL